MLLYRGGLLLRSVRAQARFLRSLVVGAPTRPRARLASFRYCSEPLAAASVVSAQPLPLALMTEPLAAATRADEGEYKLQLDHKIARVKELFGSYQLPELEVHESRRSHYRMRAEFRVWHKDEDTHYIMFDTREKEAKQIQVEAFPVGSELLNELMTKLMSEVRGKPVLRTKLYQTNFHTTLSGEAVITLIYHKRLDAEWTEAAEALRLELGRCKGCSQEKPFVVGRSRKQKVELGGSAVTERLQVDGRTLSYQQLEGSFSQPNAGVCQHMLGWARCASQNLEGDLLELYCGNGNFTVALADCFRKVIATEVAKSGVASAHENFKANGVTNAFVARLSSEEFTSAWRKERAFSRLQGTNLDEYDLQTILVDPPRAGLDPKTMELLSEFQNILYISCNPDTLKANLDQISSSHDVVKFALFDQFPYTHHTECGVLLSKKSEAAKKRKLEHESVN